MMGPVQLSKDDFLHEPAIVLFVVPETGGLGAIRFQSRHVLADRMILECFPPLPPGHPLKNEASIEVRIRLPHQSDFLVVRGKVGRVIMNAADPDGEKLSVIGIHFSELDTSVRAILTEHAKEAEASMQGQKRSTRIPVEFPVEVEGIDILSPLTAFDLSMTGMFIGTRVKFPEGKELRLFFRIPSGEDHGLNIRAEVRWSGEKFSSRLGRKCRGFGVQFVAVPIAAHESLKGYYSRFVPFA